MIVNAEWCYGPSRIRLFKHTFKASPTRSEFLQKVHSVCAADAHFVAPTATVERLWQFPPNDIEQLSRFLMHVSLPKAVALVPYAALGCAQYRE